MAATTDDMHINRSKLESKLREWGIEFVTVEHTEVEYNIIIIKISGNLRR